MISFSSAISSVYDFVCVHLRFRPFVFSSVIPFAILFSSAISSVCGEFNFWFCWAREITEIPGERERERESCAQRRREERGEFFFIIRIMKGTATVFPNALGNTVDTLGLQLKIGLLL
jgi:hypothetical protein